jgi:hypothetical protein
VGIKIDTCHDEIRLRTQNIELHGLGFINSSHNLERLKGISTGAGKFCLLLLVVLRASPGEVPSGPPKIIYTNVFSVAGLGGGTGSV